MIQMNQLWYCPLCGNLLESVFPGEGTLFCCGAPMELKNGNTGDGAKEKHVPFLYKKMENSAFASARKVIQ